MTENFSIHFWGVRGSCPTIGPNTLKYGGNTSCVQVQIGKTLIILDAGTGIYPLGNMLAQRNEKINGHIFITHTHWDHIQGLPYFSPAYVKENHFSIYGERKNHLSFDEVIKGIMRYPYFPVNWNVLKANLNFCEISNNEEIHLENGITIQTISINHPDGCLGYRITQGKKSCCYITDLEHEDTIPKNLKSFVQNTDLLIYDANYTEEEYTGNANTLSKKGWGHSTWESGIALAKAANVKKLILFHHGNHRTDMELDAIEQSAQKIYPNVFAAMEGMEIILE